MFKVQGVGFEFSRVVQRSVSRRGPKRGHVS